MDKIKTKRDKPLVEYLLDTHLVEKLLDKLKDELISHTREDLYETILRKFGKK